VTEVVRDTITFTVVLLLDEIRNRLPTKFEIKQSSKPDLVIETNDFQYALQCFINRIT
jgi:hypothetical protein